MKNRKQLKTQNILWLEPGLMMKYRNLRGAMDPSRIHWINPVRTSGHFWRPITYHFSRRNITRHLYVSVLVHCRSIMSVDSKHNRSESSSQRSSWKLTVCFYIFAPLQFFSTVVGDLLLRVCASPFSSIKWQLPRRLKLLSGSPRLERQHPLMKCLSMMASGSRVSLAGSHQYQRTLYKVLSHI